jgi:hypothetical protein
MTDRIMAIGDVHSCTEALASLLEGIQPTQQDTLVFLGDYIDRVPDSRGVVEPGRQARTIFHSASRHSGSHFLQ